jgi:DNA invertase Pin-like site-specific DNA recombinase
MISGLGADRAIDTSTAAGKAFLDMLGVFAEFETNFRRERQMEGNLRRPQARHQRRTGQESEEQRPRRQRNRSTIGHWQGECLQVVGGQ